MVFKIIAKFVNEVFGFFEEVITDSFSVQGPVAAVYFGEIIINFVFGNMRFDFDN